MKEFQQFYARSKGPMSEREDWYYLYIGATGKYVLYEWDHVQINGPSSNGVKLIELETFLDDPVYPDGAKHKLKDLLAGK